MSVVSRDDRPFVPPRYTIDLSLPPRQRYKTIAIEYKTQLKALTGLFDRLLLDLTLPTSWLPTINKISRLLLRKVHDSEQTEELRGISEETEIPMYLLVAFNVVLDLLMGCTSGAARSLESGQPDTEAKMLHFRTLDWTMDPLRRIVVQLDFVQSTSREPKKVLASSITYIGFTGVLTGVKQGLSMSLNFRAVHNARTKAAHFRFYFHHLLVLLGQRPSIASVLRQYLIGSTRTRSHAQSSPASAASDLQSRHTTAAYIILSDGRVAVTMEKDYATAKLQQSSSFIAITNHDKEEHEGVPRATPAADPTNGPALRKSSGLEELLEESTDRLRCIQQKWDAKVKRAQRAGRRANSSQSGRTQVSDQAHGVCVSRRELIKWLCDWPTSNECTHYAAILDPSAGVVAWSMAYPIPLQSPDTNV